MNTASWYPVFDPLRFNQLNFRASFESSCKALRVGALQRAGFTRVGTSSECPRKPKRLPWVETRHCSTAMRTCHYSADGGVQMARKPLAGAVDCGLSLLLPEIAGAQFCNPAQEGENKSSRGYSIAISSISAVGDSRKAHCMALVLSTRSRVAPAFASPSSFE